MLPPLAAGPMLTWCCGGTALEGLASGASGADEPVLPGADGKATVVLLLPGCADWNPVVLMLPCMLLAVATAGCGPAGRLGMGAVGAVMPSCEIDGTAGTGTGRGGCGWLLSFFCSFSSSSC